MERSIKPPDGEVVSLVIIFCTVTDDRTDEGARAETCDDQAYSLSLELFPMNALKAYRGSWNCSAPCRTVPDFDPMFPMRWPRGMYSWIMTPSISIDLTRSTSMCPVVTLSSVE